MNHLYKNFLENKDIYKKNVLYWENIVKNMLYPEKYEIKPYLSTTDGFGNEFFDGNPIYHFKVETLNKCVRIVQEEPETNRHLLFSAWLNEVEIDTNQKCDELVISLELTHETTLLAVDLINAWILRDLTNYRMKNYLTTIRNLQTLIAQQDELENVA